MLVAVKCLYCASEWSSDVSRHCHMVLCHKNDYVFSDAYNALIYARDGKPCQRADEDNERLSSPAFFAAYDSAISEARPVSALTSDLQTLNKTPHENVEKRPADVQAHDSANTVPQQSDLRSRLLSLGRERLAKLVAVSLQETFAEWGTIKTVATESASVSPNLPLVRQSSVLWTPSPSPNEVPAACDRFRSRSGTPPPRLNLLLTPSTIERLSSANDSGRCSEDAEHVTPSSNSEVLVKERPLLGSVALSPDASPTPMIPGNVSARPLTVAQDGAQTASVDASDCVSIAINRETEEPPKKIIKSEPCERDQSGIPSQNKAVVEQDVIDLTESSDEFEVTDQIGDSDVDANCITPPLKIDSEQRPSVAGDILPAPQPKGLAHQDQLSLLDNIKNAISSARGIAAYNELVPLEKKEEQSDKAGGKMRSVVVSCADRVLNCSMESSGGVKRGKPYDRARELVKKSILSRGGNQRTPVKRTDESRRYTTVYPIGHHTTQVERPLRVYETNQTDDLLRCNTCKSTKVVRELGLSVQSVAAPHEAPRFLLNSRGSRRNDRKFSVRDEQHVVRVEQLRNFDSRRRIATSYDWRLSHMQVSLDRQAECLLQNLLHLRTKMSISNDTVPSHANLLRGSPRKQVASDMIENAFARRAVLSVGLRAKQSSSRASTTVSTSHPSYYPAESSAGGFASRSNESRKNKSSPSRSSSDRWRWPRQPSPVRQTNPKKKKKNQSRRKRLHSGSQSTRWWHCDREQRESCTDLSEIPYPPSPAPYDQRYFREPRVYISDQCTNDYTCDSSRNVDRSLFYQF